MRPTGLESLRGIQAALAELVLPEMQTAFGQDSVQTLTMLLESVAAEWDTAADELHRDNATVRALLSEARDAMTASGSNADLLGLVNDIGEVLTRPEPESLAVSALKARNDELMAVLERLICELEDRAGEPENGPLMDVRARIYQHLRDLCMRGWSFWDMMSFRERMARARADG